MSAPAIPACRNCGAPAGGKYCPECGQETATHPPTALEFLREFVGHYVALEGALWRTLKALAVPGRLTLEYFAGRRRRYVLPLRLYLTASVAFFLVAKAIAPSLEVRVIPGHAAAGSSAIELNCPAGDRTCVETGRFLRSRFPGMTLPQVRELIRHRLATLFPYAMFLLVPAFALLTRTAYWNRPYNYGEHLVFALHVHAFAFFVGALLEPIRPTLMAVPVSIYLAFAARNVFGGRTWALIPRFLFIFVTYFAMLAATISVIVVAIATP